MSNQCDFCGEKHIELNLAPPGHINTAGERALLCSRCLRAAYHIIDALREVVFGRAVKQAMDLPEDCEQRVGDALRNALDTGVVYTKPTEPACDCHQPCPDCCPSEPHSFTVTIGSPDEPCPVCEEADILQRILKAIREWWAGKPSEPKDKP